MVERTGDFNSESAIGSGKAEPGSGVPECPFQCREDAQFSPSAPDSWILHQVGGGQGRAGTEGISHRLYPAVSGSPQNRAQDLGKDVSVFVSIHMGGRESGSLDAANLGGGFKFDVSRFDESANSTSGKARETGAEPGDAGCRIEQRDDVGGIAGWSSIEQHNVATEAKLRNVGEACASVGKSRPICHEGRGGDDTAGVGLYDGAIDAGCVAEIVGVDYEATHCKSLAESLEQAGAASQARRVDNWEGYRPAAAATARMGGSGGAVAGSESRSCQWLEGSLN